MNFLIQLARNAWIMRDTTNMSLSWNLPLAWGEQNLLTVLIPQLSDYLKQYMQQFLAEEGYEPIFPEIRGDIFESEWEIPITAEETESLLDPLRERALVLRAQRFAEKSRDLFGLGDAPCQIVRFFLDDQRWWIILEGQEELNPLAWGVRISNLHRKSLEEIVLAVWPQIRAQGISRRNRPSKRPRGLEDRQVLLFLDLYLPQVIVEGLFERRRREKRGWLQGGKS